MATSKTAYISALSDSTATISGPPSTLASLFSFSGPLKKARRVKLPITAAFHAPHLGTPDIERIIGPLSNSHEHYLRKDVAILSTRSGEPIAARTLGEALQHIVLDILQEPLSWSKVVQNILSNLAGQDVVLTSTGPVRAADGLRQKLTSAGINVVESTELQPLRALQPENLSSDIAIVGYAARLPESETLEDVWKILEDGRDVHKMVSPKYPSKDQNLTLDRFQEIDSTLILIVIRRERSRTRVTRRMGVSWTGLASLMQDSLTCLPEKQHKQTQPSDCYF